MSDKFKNLFDLTEYEKELLRYDTGTYRNIWIARIDAIVPNQIENVKFIEFTTDSPGGPMWADIASDVLEQTSVIQKLRDIHYISSDRLVPQILYNLLKAYRETGGEKEYPNIAIVSHKGVTYPEFLKIIEYFNNAGYKSKFILPEDIEYNGKNAYSEDFQIDIIYRRGWIKSWTDIYNKIEPLRKAYSDGNVCVVNSIRSILGSNKNLLEHLNNPLVEGILNKKERDVINKHIPWTRILGDKPCFTNEKKEVDLLEYIRVKKDQMVLKPSDLYGGSGVYIGYETTQSKWEAIINNAILTKKKYVVQEYVPIPKDIFPVVDTNSNVTWQPMKMNHNFFVFGGQYAGGWCRVSADSVINISNGAGFTPIFISMEKK
jgi:hypothetical protein